MAFDPSLEWTTEQVLDQLRQKTGKGQTVGVQVFLHGDVSADNLARVVTDLVANAEKEAGARKVHAEVGKIHRLARSFSLTADIETLTTIANFPAVKTILPSEVDDIFPRPLGVKSL